jgi:GTP-binding protein Era
MKQKIAITSFKPQTTRNRIIGVKHVEDGQMIFLDTPGIHRPRHKLGELMVKTALTACKEVDIILFMVDAESIRSEDKFIINHFRGLGKPVILTINKIDLVDKHTLLPMIDEYSRLYPFKEIIPISALKKEGVDDVVQSVYSYFSEGTQYYPEDMVTDQLERFMVSEIIREKIIKHTEQEVPHSVAVEVTSWEERGADKFGVPVIFIAADIYIERKTQKSIIIGKKGDKLKQIGIEARQDIESLLAARTFIELWVKLKERWRANERLLKQMGY